MTELTAADLAQRWAADRRWAGIARTFTAEDVVRLTGSVLEEPTLARRGAERLWAALERNGHVDALGPTTGRQAVEMVSQVALVASDWQQPGRRYPRAEAPGPALRAGRPG